MVTLTCRFRHQFTTAAKPGGTTGCPECRRGGVRTSVRVPVAARGAVAELGHQGDEGARLAALWAAEAPAVTDWRRSPAEPSPWQCDTCGAPLLWHSAHTALVCLACPTNDVSPAMRARADAHAEAISRRRGPRAELAVIDPAAEGRARGARVELHRSREALTRYAGNALLWCDAEYQRPPAAALAFKVASTIRGYLAEIRDAPDTATLAVIAAELREIRDGAEFAELVTEHNRQQEQAEAAAERAERWRQAEQQRIADEAEEAREAAAEARAAAATMRQAEAVATRQARELAAEREAIAKNPWMTTAAIIAKTTQDIQARNAAAAERRERNGTCAWCKKTAGRRYGIGTPRGQWLQDYASALACHKHYATADKWVEQQQAGTFKAYYWELDAA